MLTTILALPTTSADVSHGFLLTRLTVLLRPDATVDQLNAAARAVGATRVLTSRNGFPLLTLEVPRQASVGALIALAKTLRAQPGIATAFAARTLQPSMLPSTSAALPASSLSHLLATRFPQAWNAHTAEELSCSTRRQVPIYVVDAFDASEFAASVPFLSATPITVGTFPSDTVTAHGMRVAFTVAGQFDSLAPTGADPFPHCAVLHLVESDIDDLLTTVFVVSDAVSAETGHFILNSSANFYDPFACGDSDSDECTDANANTLESLTVKDEISQRVLFAGAVAVALKNSAG